MSRPLQPAPWPTTESTDSTSAEWSNNILSKFSQVQRHMQSQRSSAPAISLHPVRPPTQMYPHAHQQQQQQQQQQRRQHQYPHDVQHTAPLVQVSSTSINNGATRQGMTSVPFQQGRRTQAYPQGQQQPHHPSMAIQSQATFSSQTLSTAVQTPLHPASPNAPVNQASGPHQTVSGSSGVPTLNRDHQTLSTNGPPPEHLEYASLHAHRVLHKFGTPFRTLWDSMHNTLAADFLEVHAALLQEIGRLRNEATMARNAEQQAREKLDNVIQTSEGILEKAKRYKICLDETKDKLVALQNQYQLICQLALQQNERLQTRKEAPMNADSPSFDNSPAIIGYLQKRVADLEHRLKGYEDEPSDALIKPISEYLGADYKTFVPKSPDIYDPRVVNEDRCSDAGELQPKSEVSTVTELVGREPAVESSHDALSVVKAESSTRENDEPLLRETYSVNCTNIHLEMGQVPTPEPPPFHAASLPNVCSILHSTGTSSNLSLSYESARCLPPNMGELQPIHLSNQFTRPPVENVSLKRNGDGGGDGDEPAHKRLRPEDTELLTVVESRSAYAETTSGLEMASRVSVEDGEIIDDSANSSIANPSGVSSREPLEDGEVPRETGINRDDISTELSREDLLAGTEDSELTPRLNSLRMEVLYHKSLKTGEFLCRLCLLEVDAGVIDDKSAVVFPADVARDDMVDHSATAHIQALIALLQTDRAVLINTVQELYGVDAS